MNGKSEKIERRAREARAFLSEKRAERRTRLHGRFREAEQAFSSIVSLILERYAPQRIYQWGSLLDEDRFSEISDIDIALEGIVDPETFLRLLGEAEDLSPLPVDIVQLERIDPLHAESIRTRGKLIYERKED